MSLESTVLGYLAGYAPLTALVGTNVFPDVAAQGAALPIVTYSKVETEDINGLDGTRLMTRARFRVESWHGTKDVAEDVADKVVAALAANTTPTEGRQSTFDTDEGLFGASVEFDIWA